MILLRAIKGDTYAKKINNGLISCRDLLSTLLNDINTGYEFSNYYEKYAEDAFRYHMSLPLNKDLFTTQILNKLTLIFNQTIPYMYLTYFHILNKNSIENWLNITDDNMSYIYIEPKLDNFISNMSGPNFVGKEVEYVNCLSTVDQTKFTIKMAGILQFIDRDIKNVKNEEMALTYTAFIRNICLPLFHRVVDNNFSSKENEFRIISKIPTLIDQHSYELIPQKKRIFKINFNNGEIYNGEVNITNPDNNLKYCDMLLTACNPLMTKQKTSLIDEVLSGHDFNIMSQFSDINIIESTKSYG